MSDEREDVAAELRRVGEDARRRAVRAAGPPAPPPPVAGQPRPRPKGESPEPEAAPQPPDASAVNATWRTEITPPTGLRGLFYRFFDRILRPRFEGQQAFNARQVQLDNETLRYIDERFAATHRHYDRVLGLYGRHLEEADKRHLILQEELLVHVRDLVRRIDLVLAEGDRGRLALEFALEDARARLARLEETLQRRQR
jgi:hypothetical protein